MQTESFYISTPIGCLRVSCRQDKVTEIDLGMDYTYPTQLQLNTSSKSMSSFACTVKDQLESYFVNAQSGFDVEVLAEGTAFQQSVWRIIAAIKVGKTLTYTDVAKKLNSSPRAVGNACRANPVPIIVPCHRIISMSGIGGFAGQREGNNIIIKDWLLKHEQLAARAHVA